MEGSKYKYKYDRLPGGNYYVLDPGQRCAFSPLLQQALLRLSFRGWDGVNVLGDTWLAQNKPHPDDGTSYFDLSTSPMLWSSYSK